MGKLVVWKFRMELDAIKDDVLEHCLEMPADAMVLDVQFQDNGIYLWVLVDTDSEKKEYKFYSVGTGWGNVPEGLYYTGTVQQFGYVWHLFSELNLKLVKT